MSKNTIESSKGERVLDELRDFFIAYLDREGALSLRGVAKKVGVSHVSLVKFRDGGGIGFDIGVELANAIGFNLEKFLRHAS